MSTRTAVLTGIVSVGLAISTGMLAVAFGQSTDDHATWVADALIRMQSIESGMTRGELLTVFTTEGGLSSPLARTFVSRDCPYFKVDVEFRPVGRPSRGADGRVTMIEDPRDVIIAISRPYLQFSILD
jgi:hypothetical protein